MPGTGNPVTITGMTFVRIVDGKIAEGWNNWDMMGMMNQIDASGASHVIPKETAR
jgi:predicted ester cyclase